VPVDPITPPSAAPTPPPQPQPTYTRSPKVSIVNKIIFVYS